MVTFHLSRAAQQGSIFLISRSGTLNPVGRLLHWLTSSGNREDSNYFNPFPLKRRQEDVLLFLISASRVRQPRVGLTFLWLEDEPGYVKHWGDRKNQGHGVMKVRVSRACQSISTIAHSEILRSPSAFLHTKLHDPNVANSHSAMKLFHSNMA